MDAARLTYGMNTPGGPPSWWAAAAAGSSAMASSMFSFMFEAAPPTKDAVIFTETAHCVCIIHCVCRTNASRVGSSRSLCSAPPSSRAPGRALRRRDVALIVQQAKTHARRSQVSQTHAARHLMDGVADTAKVRAHLAYKNVTFSDAASSAIIAGKINQLLDA